MNSYQKINVIENNDKITFNFLNGSVDIRLGEYGAYALAPGCGAGKTTAIKQLILLKWYEGVLYAAFTKDEVNSMYQFLVENLNRSILDPQTGRQLTIDDIAVLHSDYTADGTDKDMWLNKPQELINKRIILCTHAKLLDEPLHLLFNSGFNTTTMSSLLGPDMAMINGYNESKGLPRQWILIDEITDCRPIAKIKKSILFGVGRPSDVVRTMQVINGRPIYKTVQLDRKILVRSFNSFSDFSETLKYLGSLSPEFKNTIKPEKTELDKLRNEQVLQALFHNYEDYANLRPDQDLVNIRYNYTSLINPNMKCYILLLDGTSDITLRDSGKFEVLSYQDKYNSLIDFYRFPFKLSRRLKPNLTEDMNRILIDELDKQVDNLSQIIKQNEKTLIFTWKNFKKRDDVIDDSESIEEVKNNEPVVINKDIRIDINSSFNIPEYIKSKLEEKGFKSGENFSIEYYGGGLDKATNKYKDYDGIVLLGKYQVPNSVIWEFNTMFSTNIGETEYYSNRIVQAICRGKIRLHNKSKIKIYVTDDWSENVLYYVSNYLKTGVCNIVFSNTNHELTTKIEELRKIGVSPKKAEQIAKLSKYDSMIYQSIINGQSYTCNIPLDSIYLIFPMSRKEVDKYSKMINWIRNYGIELNIQ